MLENISIHLNVDSLEGGMDGLVQVLACPEVYTCTYFVYIRESVDSLCRDDADMSMPPYI